MQIIPLASHLYALGTDGSLRYSLSQRKSYR